MKVIKKTVYSMPEFVKAIIALTKDGKEIDLAWTRGSYGQAYIVAYKEEDEESITPIAVTPVVADEATSDDVSAVEVQEEAKEQTTQEETLEAEKTTNVVEEATKAAPKKAGRPKAK